MFTHTLLFGVVYGMPLGDQVRVCNLQYIDNLLVISTNGMEDLRIVKLILYLLEGLSGLTTNLAKTCLYSTRKDCHLDMVKAGTLNYTMGLLPITYLGIPICGNKPRKQDWDLLIKKVRSKLST